MKVIFKIISGVLWSLIIIFVFYSDFKIINVFCI